MSTPPTDPTRRITLEVAFAVDGATVVAAHTLDPMLDEGRPQRSVAGAASQLGTVERLVQQ